MNIHSFLSEHWVIIYGLIMYLIGRIAGIIEESRNNKKRERHVYSIFKDR